jgi:hypothetical protein
MMMGTVKVDPKKSVCHLALVVEILMQHFFPDIDQQIPLEVVPTRMQDAFTLVVNTSELKERLQQAKQPFALSNRSLRQMWVRGQKTTKDSKEEEEKERPLMIKRRK